MWDEVAGAIVLLICHWDDGVVVAEEREERRMKVHWKPHLPQEFTKLRLGEDSCLLLEESRIKLLLVGPGRVLRLGLCTLHFLWIGG